MSFKKNIKNYGIQMYWKLFLSKILKNPDVLIEYKLSKDQMLSFDQVKERLCQRFETEMGGGTEFRKSADFL